MFARRKEVGKSYIQTNLLALGTTQYNAPFSPIPDGITAGRLTGLPAGAHKERRRLVGLTRFELVTPRLSSVCSNQLSYRPKRHFSPNSFKEPEGRPWFLQN